MSTQATHKFAVLLDGDVTPSPYLSAELAGRKIIAADGGIRHAQPLNVTPDLWVGDFDSSEQALLTKYAEIERRDFPAEKAFSDGELAINEGIHWGAKDILLVGALGGRRGDHILFHLTKALALAKSGIQITLTDGVQIATPLLAGSQILPFQEDEMTFSIVGFSELEGVTIEGAKWPLEAVKVMLGSTLTLSNVGGRNTTISVEKGDSFLFTQLRI
ncbi:MAG: thiamine diphosphokinase [Pseudomonadota bacterium]